MSSRAVRSPSHPIQVLRPRLPDAARLLSYIRRIDAARTYTNWGPLASELEARLARELGLPSGTVTLSASGTSAIVAAVLATVGRADTTARCAVVPAFTFVATGLAAEQCGFEPLIADVDLETWSLRPDACDRALLSHRVGLVIPVAPFGRAVPQEPWIAFRQRTGIPVVIDGGASIEAIASDPARFIGPVPVALSFHATKSFSTGEGGAVLTTDGDITRRIGETLNFGFAGSRACTGASFNGKASEYHAAVGHAELDGWRDKRSDLLRVASHYREAFEPFGLAHRVIGAPLVASCYVLLQCDNTGQAARVVQHMADDQIESRFWYGQGLQDHPHFADRARQDLVVTRDLAPRLVALPVAPDLSTHQIARVVDAVVGGLHPHAEGSTARNQ